MKKSKKQLFNFLFILLTLGVVLWITIGNTEIENLGEALVSAAPIWLVLGLFSFILTQFFDAFSFYYYFKKQGYSIGFWYCFYISFMGQYFNNVTPGASGGQPFQVYYLKKQGVPIGVGSSAVAVKFFCNQLVYVAFALFFLASKNELLSMVFAERSWWILIFGLVFHSFNVVIILLLTINTKWVQWVLVFIIKILTKIRLVKNANAAVAKIEGILSSFSSSVDMIKRHPKELFIQIFITSCQAFFLMAVPYCVYLSLGLSGASFIDIFALGVFLYISASHIPLPGASGAQEGGFVLFFKTIFPSNLIFAALLLWRFTTYYLQVFTGVIITLVRPITAGGKKAPSSPADDDE
ncbi:MAG: flippase-like domain-containing protein [Clostridiales bacterium]|nr:flippase-like domain-containing protein [Clostridiales bacterium]